MGKGNERTSRGRGEGQRETEGKGKGLREIRGMREEDKGIWW